ncbi:cation diffusion facilitator family transporter [Xylanimonas cellulosilytica DSM 15894]|uniref:Cation diffusion facilitator family transporter n=1 Tax=Xylanimonas cellulosilytica (strain DSM 15894 / JCM 12276 / CECT 5975 / KCTC 9989 / LMG 20990 / NBRC 107835 / XIL07) TaxID=446471 RepID=D1BRR8_XYLCX|nr:cation diffusion facilitator family transporter [Xylanimonas cellulosilytica]ACZ32334.1 cation diffusion facilitator family transporter [Xylanimonas cellulosilytica DSM 15894]
MNHGHAHAHGVADHRGRLAVAFAITAAILVAEVVGALVTGSLALLVDAAHMVVDAGGLGLALFAAHLSLRPPTSRRTWGYRRAEVLAALGQSAVLLVVGGYVLVEGVRRLWEPPEIAATELVVFGVVGLVGNLAAMLVLAPRRSANLNLRAAFLEVVNDALGSVAVIVAAVVIATTGWQRADTVAGLLIGALILPRAARLLWETTSVLLESTPPGLDLDAVRAHLLALDHVREVHDVHASLIATGLPVLSAHVVVENECFEDGHAGHILDQLQECVATHFATAVEHSTFQVEPASHPGHERPGHA